jgi:hypothetical protein
LRVSYQHKGVDGYHVFEVDWPDWLLMIPGDVIACEYMPPKTEMVVSGWIEDRR